MSYSGKLMEPKEGIMGASWSEAQVSTEVEYDIISRLKVSELRRNLEHSAGIPKTA